ncbi:DUF4181 domain-containing protein [Bacillaceae bacterium W0354]
MLDLVEPIIWLKIILALAIVILFFLFISKAMGKLLNIERKHFFRRHINERHKKIDRITRITFFILLLVAYIYSRHVSETSGFLEIWVVILLFAIVSGLTQAIMEWKYVENRREFILTTSQLALSIIFIILIMTTNFFGMF